MRREAHGQGALGRRMREEESEAVGWSPCHFFAFFCDASMRLAT
jgi:hypothetical protein